MSRIERIQDTLFLGREFLLWLWYSSEEHGGTFSFTNDSDQEEEVELFIDDRLLLEPLYGQGNRHLLSGLEPATAPEAALALQTNKLPTEAKIKVIQEARAWSFTLRGDDLLPRSLKIPEVLSAQEDDRLYERLYLLEEIERILGSLFASFLDVRLDDGWPETQTKIQSWIEEK